MSKNLKHKYSWNNSDQTQKSGYNRGETTARQDLEHAQTFFTRVAAAIFVKTWPLHDISPLQKPPRIFFVLFKFFLLFIPSFLPFFPFPFFLFCFSFFLFFFLPLFPTTFSVVRYFSLISPCVLQHDICIFFRQAEDFENQMQILATNKNNVISFFHK